MVDARCDNDFFCLNWCQLLLVGSINNHMESCMLCISSMERWVNTCKNSDSRTQAKSVQVAILVQTITSDFLKWTGRGCLYPLNGS